jgi:hypothetical protein
MSDDQDQSMPSDSNDSDTNDSGPTDEKKAEVDAAVADTDTRAEEHSDKKDGVEAYSLAKPEACDQSTQELAPTAIPKRTERTCPEDQVAPSRAWIETAELRCPLWALWWSPLARAWIETARAGCTVGLTAVAPGSAAVHPMLFAVAASQLATVKSRAKTITRTENKRRKFPSDPE